jgi:membrane peptidoglycan carboxypeptidase
VRIDYPRRGRTGVRHWLPSWRQLLSVAVLGFVAVVGTFAVLVARTDVPQPNDVATAQTTIVYWGDGKHELGRLGDANRVSVPLDQVPLTMQHAVLSAEDREFYDEGGFSPKGIGRAIWNNVSGGSVQGGSTITQQYAKNAFLTQERTFTRKFQELILAVKLDTSVSKDQILGDYLNTIYFGRGAYGIQTASQQYFGVPVSKLTLGQSAALAAIIRSPGGYSPDTNLDKLKGRWTYVLDGMVEKGWITQAERSSAVFPKFVAKKPANKFAGTNGYLLDSVRQALLQHGFTDDDINRGGLRVISTFDQQAQASAVAAVQDKGPKTGAQGLRIGLAAVRPGTGEVVAMYGGADFLTNQVNNATQALGQAGSTFKPFTLAAAVEQGITLDSIWNGNNGVVIQGRKVVNYADESLGQITLLTGTEKSVNSVYVAVTDKIGPAKVVDAAVRAGIPDSTPALHPVVLNVTLGVSSPHVIDLAGAYATFADRGQQVSPTVLKEVRGSNGGVLLKLDPTPKQAFSSDTADTVNYALRKVVTDGTGFAAMGLGRPAAGKTGTTNDNKSALFAGYTPQLAAAVMLVKDGKDGLPVSMSGVGGLRTVTGGSFPARIWTAFMKGALKGQPVEQFTDPANLPTASPTPSGATGATGATGASGATGPTGKPTSASTAPVPSTSPAPSTPTPPAPPASTPPPVSTPPAASPPPAAPAPAASSASP